MSTRLPSALPESSGHGVADAGPSNPSTPFFSSRTKAFVFGLSLAAGCAKDPTDDTGAADTDTVPEDTDTVPEDTDTVPEDTDTAPTEESPANVLDIDDLDNCAMMAAVNVIPTGFDSVQVEAVFDLTDCSDPRVTGADWFIDEALNGESTIEPFDETVTLSDGDTLQFRGGGVIVRHGLDFGVDQPNSDVSLGYYYGVAVTEIPYHDEAGWRTGLGLGELNLFCEASAGASQPTCEWSNF
jgi:hypothetical protein